MKHVDLNLLITFDAVMTERNLRKAGERLGRSQPSISQSVARLRDITGDHLFERTSSGVLPTARAEILWNDMRDPLAELQKALIPSEFNPAEQSGELTFGLSDDVRILFWPNLAKSIIDQAHRVTLRAIDCSHLTVWDDLASGRIDLALTVAGQPPPRFAARVLHQDEFVLLLNNDATPPKTATEYASLRHLALVFADERAAYADEALGAEGKTRHVVARVSRFDALPELVNRLDAVVALPRFIASHFAKQYGLKVAPTPVPFPPAILKLCWHEKNRNNDQHKWLRELSLETVIRSLTKRRT
ncbi:MAG: LysR family transcriptional regulator [Pseudomonadota bacterium]